MVDEAPGLGRRFVTDALSWGQAFAVGGLTGLRGGCSVSASVVYNYSKWVIMPEGDRRL